MPRHIAPGVTIRVLRDTWGDSPPFAKGLWVTVIEVREEATHDGVRSAVEPAIRLKNELRSANPAYGPKFLLEIYWQEHHHAGVSYGELAARANSQLEEALRGELRGHQSWGRFAHVLLEGFRKRGLGLRELEREHQRLLEVVRSGKRAKWMTFERMRDALRNWGRGKAHREWVDRKRGSGKDMIVLSSSS